MNIDIPLVSVIIPSYNHEKYIQDTIISLLGQTYKNMELIIIDDGSKDNTFEKIIEMKEKCEARFVRVVFQKQENIGCALTLNKLIKEAKGEYLYFIASDDLAKSNAIEIEVDFLNKNQDYGLVVGNNEIIDSDGVKCYWDNERNNVYTEQKAKYRTFVDFLSANHPYFNKKFGLYSTLYRCNYIPNGYMIRKTLIKMIEPFTIEAPLEDWFLMLQLSKYCKFKYLDKILFSYRWHEHNTIKKSAIMNNYHTKTRKHEELILSKLNKIKNELLPEVKVVASYGVLYKRRGIPYIAELQTYRKDENKLKIFKIFNIKIFSFTKIKGF